MEKLLDGVCYNSFATKTTCGGISMNKRMKTFFSLMFAVLMTCTLVSVKLFAEAAVINAALDEYAGMQSTDGTEGYLSLNGDKLESLSDVSLHYGDTIGIQLYWTFRNEDHEFAVGSTFTYELPEGIAFADLGGSVNGSLFNGTEAVGTYSITDHVLTLTYTDAEFCSTSNREGSLALEGTITKESIGNADGGDKSFVFPGIGSLEGNLERDTSSDAVTAAKEISSHNGLTYTFKLSVTASGPQTGVIVTDTMGEYLTLVSDSVKFYSFRQSTTSDPLDQLLVNALSF